MDFLHRDTNDSRNNNKISLGFHDDNTRDR